MAKQYPIPQDTNEKEKIIGGIFTLSQFLFIVAAAVVAIFGGLGLYALTNNMAVSLLVISVPVGCLLPFGFIKVRKYGDIELFQFFVMKYKYSHGPKEYINISDNYKEDSE